MGFFLQKLMARTFRRWSFSETNRVSLLVLIGSIVWSSGVLTIQTHQAPKIFNSPFAERISPFRGNYLCLLGHLGPLNSFRGGKIRQLLHSRGNMFQAPLVLPLLKAAATRISPHEVHHVTQKNSEVEGVCFWTCFCRTRSTKKSLNLKDIPTYLDLLYQIKLELDWNNVMI